MGITKEEILHVVELARLEIGEQEIDAFAGQIAEILAYIDQLREVDTTGVPGTAHAGFLKNAFREDEERPHLPRQEALANAPEADHESFLVPRVI
ncbi:MAG: Asp-tRNA(Asn)/Glu-tRNA(Gln) amidotransferase subunit GatC [Desulfobacterales bacterium]